MSSLVTVVEDEPALVECEGDDVAVCQSVDVDMSLLHPDGPDEIEVIPGVVMNKVDSFDGSVFLEVQIQLNSIINSC